MILEIIDIPCYKCGSLTAMSIEIPDYDIYIEIKENLVTECIACIIERYRKEDE